MAVTRALDGWPGIILIAAAGLLVVEPPAATRRTTVNMSEGRPRVNRPALVIVAQSAAPAGVPPVQSEGGAPPGSSQKLTTPSSITPWNLPPLRMSVAGKSSYSCLTYSSFASTPGVMNHPPAT